MQINNRHLRSPRLHRCGMTAMVVLALVVTAGVVLELRQPLSLNISKGQHGFCMSMIEDFCPGQPVARAENKQRTLALM
ncbi:MAG: hypothetical protein ACI81O_001850 [Cyclobacteriaceae bacterium]|jgi:hypothetical protein